MITKQEIIYKLYPNIRTLRGQQSGQEATSWDAFDVDGNPVSFDMTPVDAEYDSQEYARDRATEYPEIKDQLDMLWHAIDTGDWTAAKVKLTSFYTELKAVKDKYPKE